MSKKSRIILLRHGEEPNFDHDHKLKKHDSEIGLTHQGAIRSHFLPTLVQKILGKKKYELHTYTHLKNDEPISRSYYTVQNLMLSSQCKNVVLYNKSDNIYELVENVMSSSKVNKNIIICWEHSQIPVIISKLLDLETKPNYNKCIKYANKLPKKKIVEKNKISTSDIEYVQRCAKYIEKENDEIKGESVSVKGDMSYALVWDINMTKKEYCVYPGFTIKPKKKDTWLIKYYV
jgi:hypothetical protein